VSSSAAAKSFLRAEGEGQSWGSSSRTPHRVRESTPSKRHQSLDFNNIRDLARQLHRFLMFFLACGGEDSSTMTTW
jgi:hypothetical protein